MAVIIIGFLAACGPEEELQVIQVHGEDKVQPVKLGGVNIYLIQTESGYILVDTGMPMMSEQLDQAFVQAEVDPKSVQMIVLTHGHMDHIGLVAHAKEVTGGKVLCHRSLADNLRNSKIERAVPRTRNIGTRLMNSLTRWLKYAGVEPDIVMDDEFDLGKYGIKGRIIHTPGHSASSISIVLDNGEALIGDMVREEDTGEIGLGAFYEDDRVLLESLIKVADLEPRTIYLSHGNTIDSDTLRGVIAASE
jgi:glyoxylase-like metal-dependent hydrolase (beta-lactamase superfamily II)